MARKIFVSYKYADSNVPQIAGEIIDEFQLTTARNYVNRFVDKIGEEHIYKGEQDGESLQNFKDGTIESKLRDKIFDSSVTVVLISRGMNDGLLDESEQWIPWEISYSLKEMTRGDRTSRTNAMIGVILPDITGSYDYYIENHPCTTRYRTDRMFKIIGTNMFNRSNKNLVRCDSCNGAHHQGNDHSYIHPVKWEEFMVNPNAFIEHAATLQESLDDFDITKEIPS